MHAELHPSQRQSARPCWASHPSEAGEAGRPGKCRSTIRRLILSPGRNRSAILERRRLRSNNCSIIRQASALRRPAREMTVRGSIFSAIVETNELRNWHSIQARHVAIRHMRWLMRRWSVSMSPASPTMSLPSNHYSSLLVVSIGGSNTTMAARISAGTRRMEWACRRGTWRESLIACFTTASGKRTRSSRPGLSNRPQRESGNAFQNQRRDILPRLAIAQPFGRGIEDPEGCSL